MIKPVVCRRKDTGDAYQFFGQSRWKNLRTGVEGEISDEAAQKWMVINLDATELLHHHPLIEELISVLQLRFDK